MDFDGFKRFKMDDNLEAGEGVRVEYEEGKAITMRRAGGANAEYAKVLATRGKKYASELRNGTISAANSQRLIAEVYGEAVIIGWDGITAEGKPVPFTHENVVNLLLAMPDLFAAIQRDANDPSLFQVEEIVKN